MSSFERIITANNISCIAKRNDACRFLPLIDWSSDLGSTKISVKPICEQAFASRCPFFRLQMMMGAESGLCKCAEVKQRAACTRHPAQTKRPQSRPGLFRRLRTQSRRRPCTGIGNDYTLGVVFPPDFVAVSAP